jgi:hypothetical protein
MWSYIREVFVEFYALVLLLGIFDHTCEYTYSSSCMYQIGWEKEKFLVTNNFFLELFENKLRK